LGIGQLVYVSVQLLQEAIKVRERRLLGDAEVAVQFCLNHRFPNQLLENGQFGLVHGFGVVVLLQLNLKLG
jgi:hypothetical protein